MTTASHRGWFTAGRVCAVALVFAGVAWAEPAGPERDKALAAMKKAADFMVNEASVKGGFVWRYSEDLSERWGEVPARDTMFWIQDPATVGVGRMLLDAYRMTGDAAFLRHAETVTNALVFAQLREGGWHYFGDFDPSGVEKWYEEEAWHFWGWEEYYHFYGNATFDDDVTAGATDFLLDFYLTTLDPRYREPLLRALDFILEAQFPNGAWPQRYPLKHEHPSGGRPDYTSFYTLNDGVTTNNIHLLIKAYETLGDEAYREAALRGMDFVLLAQRGAPQAGWAQQYDWNMQPAQARSYEPAALSPSTTASMVQHLYRFYEFTGDRRYLRGIPDALDWLEHSKLPPGHSDEGHTHAQFVELGTNRPLYAHREGSTRADGRYWVDYVPGNFPGHYGMQTRIDVDRMREEYARVSAMTPEEACAAHEAARRTSPSVPEISLEQVRAVLDAMDARGAWTEDFSVPDYHDWKFRPRRDVRGIDTRTFKENMYTLMYHVSASTG